MVGRPPRRTVSTTPCTEPVTCETLPLTSLALIAETTAVQKARSDVEGYEKQLSALPVSKGLFGEENQQPAVFLRRQMNQTVERRGKDLPDQFLTGGGEQSAVLE